MGGLADLILAKDIPPSPFPPVHFCCCLPWFNSLIPGIIRCSKEGETLHKEEKVEEAIMDDGLEEMLQVG